MKFFIHKKVISFAASVLFLMSVISICRYINTHKNGVSANSPELISNIPEKLETTQINKQKMVGAWVSYLDLNICSKENTEQKFIETFENILSTAEAHKINTLIVHVRSHGDALYKSNFFPWSHLLTGVQGENPGFDPLEYMVKSCHEKNINFHAWINPLRIQLNNSPENLSANNPYYNQPESHIIKTPSGIYYDPSYKETRDLITSGVEEIVKNYNVDAIHFDDYFYPEDYKISEKEDNYLSKKENVNLLIAEVNEKIKSINPNVEFGISPPGNIKKCQKIGADPKTWLEKKYIDYICPQLYWSIDCPQMPFEKAANEWKRISGNAPQKIYAGLALYKIGTDLDAKTWNSSGKILSEEFKIIQNLNFDGIMLYSINFLNDNLCQTEIKNLMQEIK
ncbi:MAG: glycoside hydrolase family 10 protein [Acutalibacteraceae bacterium]